MKKKMSSIFLVVFMLMSTFISTTMAVSYKTMYLNKTIEIIYDGKTQGFSDVSGKTVYPISYEGTTYLPVRAITSMFDMTISWESMSNTVYMSTEHSDENNFSASEIEEFIPEDAVLIAALVNDEIIIRFNDKVQEFKDANGKIVYPISYEGTTYLPIRAISTLYNAEIEWNGEKNQITIAKPTEIISGDSYQNEDGIDTSDSKNFDFTATYINNENRFAEITLEKQTSEKALFTLKGVTLNGSGYIVRYPVMFQDGVAYCEEVDLKIYLSGNRIVLETENESNAILRGTYVKEGKEQRTIVVTENETNQWNGSFKKSETISMTLGQLSEDVIAMGLIKVNEKEETVSTVVTMLQKTDDKSAYSNSSEMGEIKRYKITYFEEDKINVTVDTDDIITNKLFSGVYIREEFTPREMYLKLKDSLDKTSMGEGVTGHMLMGI